MPTANVNIRVTNANNDTFRSWGSTISTQIAAMGMVQTADTGQINWTTVSTPNTSPGWQGYEIWQFNDALQNTSPVFIKLEYGAITNPNLVFQFGTGSWGNGSLTGLISPPRLTGAWAPPFANTANCFFSGDNNRFIAAMVMQGTTVDQTCSWLFGWERTVNANGEVTGDGVTLFYKNSGTLIGSMYSQFWHTVLGCVNGYWLNTTGMMATSQPATSFSNNTTRVFPQYHDTVAGFLNPGLNFLGNYSADFTAFVPVSIPHYNMFHTYLPLSSAVIPQTCLRNTSTSLMIRWE